MRRVKKSRNGCARCKSKRVKCGEEKPYCSRCTRLGVKCPGYVQSLRWVTNQPQTNNGETSQSPTIINNFHGSPKLDPPRSDFVQQAQSPLTIHVEEFNARDPGGLDIVDEDDPAALCDNLWNLQQSGSLPELDDLCPPSPASRVSIANPNPADTSAVEFGSPASQGSDPLGFFSMAAPTLQNESFNFSGFAPSAIVRKYPPASSPPHRPAPRDLTSIPQPLNNPSWTLIEYYFKEVAALFSSYDSQMNPFRTTVSRLWGSSLAMCRTMQSMAAATLVNDFPQFGPMGKKMRNEAVEIISKETTMDDKSLLALLMLGQSASWHDPKDLGISFFNLLRHHLDNTVSTKPMGPANRSNNHQFFEEALVYWEMLLSFVADDAAVMPAPTSPTNVAESLVLQRVPHPWTGIARDTQFTVQEAGRLVRNERKRISSRRFTSQADILRAQQALEKARELEERLLSLAHPTEAEIVSPGDDETPVWHLLTMAEVYRCTGLLQLYRAFPDLLHRRLPLQHQSPLDNNSSNTPRDPFFPIHSDPMINDNGNGNDNPSGTNNNTNTNTNNNNNAPWLCDPPPFLPPSHHPSPTDPMATGIPDPSYYDTWLTEFALTTLSRLKTIPLESRTRCLQPLLLVASSSELRLPTQPAVPSDPSLGNGPCISSHALEVSRTRRFILGRLTSFLHVLPPKPINVCLQIVQEVWKRMDAGDSEVYWMDVMIEKGWETTMG